MVAARWAPTWDARARALDPIRHSGREKSRGARRVEPFSRRSGLARRVHERAVPIMSNIHSSTANGCARSVRFNGDAEELRGISVREPSPVVALPWLHAVLRRARIHVRSIRLSASPHWVSYDLELCEADGSPVSARQWARVQGPVLDCVLGAGAAVDRRPALAPRRRVRSPAPRAVLAPAAE